MSGFNGSRRICFADRWADERRRHAVASSRLALARVLVLGAVNDATRLAPALVLSKAQADSVLRVMDEAPAEISDRRHSSITRA